MKLLDKIFHQRLERIRDKINSYIAERIEYKSSEISLPISEPVFSHTSVDGIQEKFLDMHSLEEADIADFAFANEEDDNAEEEQISSVPMQSMATPPQQMSSSRPSEMPIPEFLHSESKKRTIDEVLRTKAETFSSMLLRLIDEKGLKDSEVYKKANIDRRLFSKIRGDEDYVPSRKTAISFCLALQLELEEAKKLLETAGYALSTSSRFDLIIMYLIENKEYNIHFANIVLEDYGEGTLSK